ncbi:Asp23/Gls24 family envelope stress response protein [Herbiconiux sp. CPCC 203407]|uniref:Asp23/Gls24 family envelope stress response protein n=1 Tax=Herbiconiux oxytropis TaxID=2970915 RepID=A0AA42BTW1_9MICO|nr:Asp23/Gls24 family envelope stress response protein [Herbiconiux oxytropis]MCS5723056.1 Asp23/Gls24 family envelope stress response protein [Herbiconiux oxytropis]MCS5726875.1 Asp23/Gls24 family envelope stress response protein [Herbiconiux oxytropis]
MATSTPTPTPTPATVTSTTSSPTNVQTALGKTVINDGVVAKVAGIAAREARGVFALGGGAARAFGAIREAVGGVDQTQGISVEVGETQVAVDVTIVAEYPLSLQDVADGVRSGVIQAVETIVGLQVTEVNVTVNDVHLPSDDVAETTEARVQ